MTTYRPTSFLYELATGQPIPLSKRAYFGGRLRNRLYNFVLTKFLEKEASGELTKAELARRIGRRPEVITRLLASPGNWKLDTVSDLLLGISGEELGFSAFSPAALPRRNLVRPEWLDENLQTPQSQERIEQPGSPLSRLPSSQQQQPTSARSHAHQSDRGRQVAA